MKQVIIVVPQGDINMSSITGSYEILHRANLFWQSLGNKPMMEIHVAGFLTGMKADSGCFSVNTENISDLGKADLIVIPSIAYDVNIVKNNQQLVNWMVDEYKCGAEIASMCSGVFLLAATGLLEGLTCSTHWRLAPDFRRLFPTVDIQADKLITVEKGIYTNGGGYSFLNLMLLLVEKYFDRQTAIICSKIFQIDIARSSQSPFHIFKIQKSHGDELISKAQNYIEENLNAKISFEELASKLAISRRNFDRRFIKATGNTPVEYLQRAKVEVAKSNLERGRKTIYEVMTEVGYADDKAFREVFKKITGLSPLDYRAKYNREAILA